MISFLFHGFSIMLYILIHRPSSRLTGTPVAASSARKSSKRNLSLTSPLIGSGKRGRQESTDENSSAVNDTNGREEDSPVKKGKPRKRIRAILSDEDSD